MKYFGKTDSIIANQDFLISDYPENIGASVMYQRFLNCHEQLTEAEVKESQANASVKIY